MKSRIVHISFLLLFLTTGHAQFGGISDAARLAVSFSSIYPTSAVTQAKSLATQLWTEVNTAVEDVAARDVLENSIVNFAHTVLNLYVLCDLLIQDAHAQLNGVGVRYQNKDVQKTLEEMRYLTDLVHSLEETFDQAMDGHVSDQAACVKVVLDCLKKKMERTLLSAP